MKCPRCGESNPESYRFCGMCGGVLPAEKQEPTAGQRRTVAGSVAAAMHRSETPLPSGLERQGTGQTAEHGASHVGDRPAAAKTVPQTTIPQAMRPNGGAPVIGPTQPALVSPERGQLPSNPPGPRQPEPPGPSADTLRDQVFTGGSSIYVEPEQEGLPWGRIVAAVVILGALCGAGWWGYTRYAGGEQNGKADSAVAINTGGEVAGSSAQDSGAKASPEPATNASPPAPSASTSADQPVAAAPVPSAPVKSVEPVRQKTPAKPAPKGAAHASREEPSRTKTVASAKPAVAKPVTAVSTAEADALFHKGEAFLYGRGGPKNCDQAIKYLKSASDKSSAKARSAFGTMYATGHCVPRDLPSSYRWFALALRADPNNTILEKDLSAVWNQMTPPERQAATKSQ